MVFFTGAGADQLADPDAGQRVVVRDHRQIAFALAHELVHEALGRTHAHEPADHHARAVGMSATASFK
jgi:hypothetical protein